MLENQPRIRTKTLMKIAAMAILAMSAAAAMALPSQKDVEAALRASNWPAAETMLKEVVAAKPTNAKAWYLLAETEEKLGNKGDAIEDLRKAEQLDPSQAFASPGAVQAMEARLTQQPRAVARQHQNAPAMRTSSASSDSGSSAGMWIMGVFIALFLFWLVFIAIRGIWRMVFGYPVIHGGYGSGYGAPGSTVVVNNGGSGTGLLGSLLIADAIRDNHHDQGGSYGSSQGYEAPPPPPSPGFDLGGSSEGWDSGSSSSGSSGSDDW